MNYTDEQISLAFDKLSRGVQDVIFSPEIEQKIQKIGTEAGLHADQIKKLTGLVNFAIMDLLSRQDFSSVIEKELVLSQKTSQELTSDFSREIFASIEAMEAQTKKEQGFYEVGEKKATENTERVTEVVPASEKPKTPTVQMTDVAPDNLPTGEEESFLPNLAPKTNAEAGEPTHPFEEKMKRVFTAGQQSMSDLAIEPAPQAPLEVAKAPSVPLSPTGQVNIVQTPKTPPAPRVADPYREAIE